VQNISITFLTVFSIISMLKNVIFGATARNFTLGKRGGGEREKER